jgi:hypothetical protein
MPFCPYINSSDFWSSKNRDIIVSKQSPLKIKFLATTVKLLDHGSHGTILVVIYPGYDHNFG